MSSLSFRRQNFRQNYKKFSDTFEMFEFERIDPRGRTPLHLAISLGEFEIARMLLVSGANPTSKNAGGWSALHEAVSFWIFNFSNFSEVFVLFNFFNRSEIFLMNVYAPYTGPKIANFVCGYANGGRSAVLAL